MDEFRHETTLKDGTLVLIRLYEPGDSEEIYAGLRRLSDSTTYLRFMTCLNSLPNERLLELKKIDHDHHLAICAFDLSKDPMVGMGIARYVRMESDSLIAEAAVTILDEYQNKGLGTELLYILTKLASQKGVTHLRAHVLSTNKPILAIARKVGSKISHYEGQVLQVDWPVDEALETFIRARGS
ncbi:MAG: GNAT family N-acetyltransferase [Candidatus Thorarchaeota archaeon]|nr:MAG: GNAT family N-acetyltransferase [Candidatus Thorarchaeota archaeon]